MNIGTRSVLFGAHCWFLHPWFVAAGWWKLYGAPLDLRLWVAFFVHDLGYWGKPNMDGEEGEMHPILGARVMAALFDWNWAEFVLFHSRYFSKAFDRQPSRLCAADKMAIALTPAWLYLPMVRATGEIHEYMRYSVSTSKHEPMTDQERAGLTSRDYRAWYRAVQSHCYRWALEHKDGSTDTWTSRESKRA